jgi:hypothetical protein
MGENDLKGLIGIDEKLYFLKDLEILEIYSDDPYEGRRKNDFFHLLEDYLRNLGDVMIDRLILVRFKLFPNFICAFIQDNGQLTQAKEIPTGFVDFREVDGNNVPIDILKSIRADPTYTKEDIKEFGHHFYFGIIDPQVFAVIHQKQIDKSIKI